MFGMFILTLLTYMKKK
ncbi:putative holin-like toxin [Paenibacillus sp. AK002]